MNTTLTCSPKVCWLLIVCWLISCPTSGTAIGEDSLPAPGKYSQFNRSQSLNRDVSFQKAVEVTPGKTTTRINLTVKDAVNLIDGVKLRHRSYNGGLVGPTIRVNRGQTLQVHLRNLLVTEPTEPRHTSLPHGFNTTNLHTHGLHVSPNSPADDVFKRIKPGESFDYRFEIGAGHPAGTFWYHAHKHGSTALQLASGMSGALIVNGGLDDAPVIRDAVEKIMVLQQFTYKEDGDGYAFVDPDLVYSGTGPIVEAINGVVTPTVVMRPGEVQRWRIIHAGTTEVINLDIEGVNFHEIAVDGLATGKLISRNRLQLYPGYRFDVLVQAPMRNSERLVTSEIKNAAESVRQVISAERSLLRLVIEGEPKLMRLPTDAELAPYAELTQLDVPRDADIANRRKIEFSQDGQNRFLINGEVFDPATTQQTLDLGTADEWEISSRGGVHPFHIHVNPFAVRRKGTDDAWVWRDTIAVSRRQPMILRTRYETFTGRTVLHCHNLWHEDQGMMQAIEIVDAQSPESDSTRPLSTATGGVGRSPSWSAKTMRNTTFSSQNISNRPALLVFHRGMHCIHCAQQLVVLNDHHARFQQAGIQVVTISQFVPDDADTQQVISEFKFPVLVDNELECFRRFHCIGNQGVPNHGLFLIDRDGRILMEKQTDVAVTRVDQLVDQVIAKLHKKDR